jgi:hypothetical protein
LIGLRLATVSEMSRAIERAIKKAADTRELLTGLIRRIFAERAAEKHHRDSFPPSHVREAHK